MSAITTMTSKGQVTIPKRVRDELGLRPYDKIEIVADGEGGQTAESAPARSRVDRHPAGQRPFGRRCDGAC